MDELLEILEDLDPDIDFEHETRLIDDKILNSFSIIALVSNISEEFDIEISPAYLVAENFNSVDAMWKMIQRIQEEDE